MGEFLRLLQPLSMFAGLVPANKRIESFVKGRIAMMPVGVWTYQEIQAAGCRWTSLPLPRERERATLVTGRGYGLLKHSPHPDTARRFLRLLPSWQLWAENRRKLPALPLHQSLEVDNHIESTYREALTYARPLLSDIAPAVRRMIHEPSLTIVLRHLDELVHGDEPVSEVLSRVTEEIDFLISRVEDAPTH